MSDIADFTRTASWNEDVGEFHLLDERALMISLDTFSKILHHIDDITGQGEVVFYETFKAAGRHWAVKFHERWGPDLSDSLRSLEKLFATIGWGKVSLSLDGETLTVEVSSCPSELRADNYAFWRGYGSGIAEGILGSPMDAGEVREAAARDGGFDFVVTRAES